MGKRLFTKREEDALIGWVVTIILAFIFLIGLVFRNCIFEWPIRWDFGTCVKDQWEPAVQEAVEFPKVK